MQKKNGRCLLLFAIVTILSIPSSFALAADKVAVIPLIRTVNVPFAPVATTSPSNTKYTIGTNSVTDKITGLVWQRTNDNTGRDWNDAWTYCHGLTLDSKKDWRLPSVHELTSIVYYGTDSPAINNTAFPATNSSFYWSATTMATDISSELAWYVNFYDGSAKYRDKSNPSYVRCVR